MNTSQDTTFTFTMAQEGGADVSLDPEDNGNWSSNEAGVGTLIGSKYGVSAIDLIRYLDPQQVTAATMAGIPQDTAEAIWNPSYWAAVSADSLPLGLDLMCADHGYNRGVSAGGKTLQHVVDADQDGWIGPDTLKAMRLAMSVISTKQTLSANAARRLQAKVGAIADGVYGPQTQSAVEKSQRGRLWLLTAMLADAQAADYRTLRQFPKYGNGWTARVWARLDAALALSVDA